nr:immunoglobulin light chain junction region [Mus musculus]
CALWYSTHFVF